MREQHFSRKTPSVAELMQNRAAEEAAHEAERADQQIALRVVERWNAERSVLWSPTIRCAITAGTPWLDVVPVARQVELSTFAQSTVIRLRRSGAFCSACYGRAAATAVGWDKYYLGSVAMGTHKKAPAFTPGLSTVGRALGERKRSSANRHCGR